MKYYRLAGNHEAAITAMRESAIAHAEIQSYHTSAADLEQAATLTATELKENATAATLFKESAYYYRMNGSHDKSAAMLVKQAE